MVDIDTPKTPERSDPDGPDQSDAAGPDRSALAVNQPARWPVWIALPLIFAVFVAGAVWSFREQTALARSAGFHLPELLPLVIDGFAAAMAAVAWAASLDGRAAVLARLGISVGIACSVGANAAWAWERSGADRLTVILAGGVPVLAMLAFEAVLAEVRRQVQRRRGMPGPVPVPWPRLIRVVWAPWSTVRSWRRLVLDVTDPVHQFAAVQAAGPDRSPELPPTGPPSAPDPVREGPETGATVTSIARSGPRRGTSGRPRRTGRASGRQTAHSPTALADAQELLDRYGDDLPARSVISRETGWGSPKAGNALRAVPAVRASRRERSTAGSPDRADRDDLESEAAA